jgi:hypothetical protein
MVSSWLSTLPELLKLPEIVPRAFGSTVLLVITALKL